MENEARIRQLEEELRNLKFLMGQFNPSLTYNKTIGGDVVVDGQITCTGVDASGNITCSNLVTGPASATDNAIVRFDATTGKLVQNSGVTIDDSNNLSMPGKLSVDHLGEVTSSHGIVFDNYASIQKNSIFAAYLTSALTISGAPAWYEIGAGTETFTEYFDIGSNFDASGTGRYTAPVAGYYQFDFYGYIDITGGSMQLATAGVAYGIDGTVTRAIGVHASDNLLYNKGMSGSVLLSLSASQTVSMWVYAAESSTNAPRVTVAVFSGRLVTL